MARDSTTKQQKYHEAEAPEAAAFQLRDGEETTAEKESEEHVLGPGIICDTEGRGYATPQGQSLEELVLHAPQGFIPLWAAQTTLYWRFNERSMRNFANPEAAKREIRGLFGEALLKWGVAAPITFSENQNLWDFEIVMRGSDNCNPGGGCVLASAFFPDSGRHQLVLYPRMFTQSRKEQVDTLVHEIGHIFGLRHFFANVSETAWPVQIFGTHSAFSIMNYGELSELTAVDKDDLTRLYQSAWSGVLRHVNGTPIRFVEPFHTLAPAPNRIVTDSSFQSAGGALAPAPDNMVAVGQFQPAVAMPARTAYLSTPEVDGAKGGDKQRDPE